MSVLSFARLTGGKLILAWLDDNGHVQKDWFYVCGTRVAFWEFSSTGRSAKTHRVQANSPRIRGGLRIASDYVAYRRACEAERRHPSVRGFNHHRLVVNRLLGAAS